MNDLPPNAAQGADASQSASSSAREPIWRFRGYELRASEFTTAMVHYYRAEIQRSNTWRNRLDATTNWAVLVTSAALTFAFSAPTHHYSVIVLNTLLITLFLWIEARRYRYYELWSLRTRLMETDFFAAMLVPPFRPQPDWAENLAQSLLRPEFPISMWEALGRRFRRNYSWVFLVLGLAWLLKLYLHPHIAATWDILIERSALGPIPGQVMLVAGAVFYALMFGVGLATTRLRQASGEVLGKFEMGDLDLLRALRQAGNGSAAQPQSNGSRQADRPPLLCLIVSGDAPTLASRIAAEMKCPVTTVPGEGMWNEPRRDVLLVAVMAGELDRLRALTRAHDPQALSIVIPASEVVGSASNYTGM
ncbi:MAG: DUF2270 domain-containing protein [Anaerolineae bacterium]|nr:DUF2270 domain-containing protein [Thermoflexales bacterium]MDW8407286.1 DUF2270 domain-containing protein [Anaerolineae bacterium]